MKSCIPPGVLITITPDAHAIAAVKVSISLFILKLELTKLYQLDVLNLTQCFEFDFFGVILRELYNVLKETSFVKVEIGQISLNLFLSEITKSLFCF